MSECLLRSNRITGETIQKQCLAGWNLLTPEGLCASDPFLGMREAVSHPHIWATPEAPLDPAGKLQGHQALFFIDLDIGCSAWHALCLGITSSPPAPTGKLGSSSNIWLMRKGTTRR